MILSAPVYPLTKATFKLKRNVNDRPRSVMKRDQVLNERRAVVVSPLGTPVSPSTQLVQRKPLKVFPSAPSMDTDVDGKFGHNSASVAPQQLQWVKSWVLNDYGYYYYYYYYYGHTSPCYDWLSEKEASPCRDRHLDTRQNGGALNSFSSRYSAG